MQVLLPIAGAMDDPAGHQVHGLEVGQQAPVLIAGQRGQEAVLRGIVTREFGAALLPGGEARRLIPKKRRSHGHWDPQ